jgi:hypothetical protein
MVIVGQQDHSALSHFEDKRLAILPQPLVTLGAGSATRIAISTGVVPVARIRSVWRGYEYGSLGPHLSDADVTLTRNADGSEFVMVTPPKAGSLRLTLQVIYTDGVIASQSLDYTVGTSEDTPARLIFVASGLDQTAKVGTLYLNLESTSGRQIGVTPLAFYNNGEAPVVIPRTEVTFQVRNGTASNSVIDFDPTTGIVKALRPGHALIQGIFRGAKAYVCVVVASTAHGTVRSDCRDLKTSDERVESVEEAPTGSGPSIIVKPK